MSSIIGGRQYRVKYEAVFQVPAPVGLPPGVPPEEMLAATVQQSISLTSGLIGTPGVFLGCSCQVIEVTPELLAQEEEARRHMADGLRVMPSGVDKKRPRE